MADEAQAAPLSPDEVKTILRNNDHLDFVKRILEPDKYPVVQNQDGSHSTHLMAWSGPDENGLSYVYPTIVHNNGKMTQLPPDLALQVAKANNELITFNDPKMAAWFSEHYKLGWGAGPELGNNALGKMMRKSR